MKNYKNKFKKILYNKNHKNSIVRKKISIVKNLKSTISYLHKDFLDYVRYIFKKLF